MTDFDRNATKEFLGVYPHQVIAKERELVGDEAEVAGLFSFTDKASYCAWVKEWKVLLKSLEAEIRAQKVARKGDTSGSAQMYREMYRHQAHALHIRRRLAKRVSWQMRQARVAEMEAA